MKLSACLLVCSLVLTTGCRGARHKPDAEVVPPPPTTAPVPPPEEKPLPRTGLKLKVDPPEAEVIIDERSYGAASTLGSVELPPGIYRVSVKAPGYTTWRAEVAVGDRLEMVDVSLPKRQ